MNRIAELYEFLIDLPFFDLGMFLILILASVLIGKYTTEIFKFSLFIFPRQQRYKIFSNLIEPIRNTINRTGIWILLYFSWRWIKKQEDLPNWPEFFIDFIFTIFIIWFFCRLFHQFIKFYGISLFKNIGGEVTEFLLTFEVIFDIIIGLIAVCIFAVRHGIPLTGVLAGVSIGGLALSFAAQNTLQQIFGTVILFFDKPFIQGEYIRLPDGTFGRIESIGLRSTKMRTAAKNTLLIIPNSKMADWEIENITRGKKIMILVYLDFKRLLEAHEKSLVKQIITKHINSFFGVEPETYNITFLRHPDREVNRVRVTFFILGSTKSSVDLRKRMIQISENQLLQELKTYGLNYTANEPVISVDSPITL